MLLNIFCTTNNMFWVYKKNNCTNIDGRIGI